MKDFFRKKLLLLGFILASNMILAQTTKITGTVTDEVGSPLPGVNIIVKGTTKRNTNRF